MDREKKPRVATCPNETCGFATSKPYNFCPHCGRSLFFMDETPVRDTLSFIGSGSRCPSAGRCQLLGMYEERCETLEVSNLCVNSILGHLELLEIQIQRRLPEIRGRGHEEGKR